LPDSPVIVWWPGGAPKVPADDPLGQLGRRRVTDAAAGRRATVDFTARAEGYAPGDTDFAWTRITPWRALLAAALDQYPTTVTGAEVVSAKGNTSADLLAAWLQCRLGVTVEQKTSRGPGITATRLFTATGPIAVTRPDGAVATFSIPGQPDRPVALKRRSTAELLSEELRRLDPDEVYAKTLACLVERDKLPPEAKTIEPADRRSAQTAAKKAATRTADAASAELKAKATSKPREATKGTTKKTSTKKTSASTAKTAAAKTVAAKKAGPKKAGPKKTTKSAGKRAAGQS
jgi:hypothetical protein